MEEKLKIQLIRLFTAFLIILAIISSFIVYQYWPLLTGGKIVLATRPVDPYDPLRGQYMSINYEISNIENLSEDFKSGDYVYVLLKKDNQSIWRYENFSKAKPTKGDFVRGKVLSYGNNVQYGIEQFFFETGAVIPTTNLTVEVKVSDSGRAKISQLLYNGKPVEIDSKGGGGYNPFFPF